MKVNTRIYSAEHKKYITYIGKAYNAKDYEFTDDSGNLIVLNQDQVDHLEKIFS